MGAEKALRAVAGRRFNGKIVDAVFYPEDLFLQKRFVEPSDYDKSDLSAEKNLSYPTDVRGEDLD